MLVKRKRWDKTFSNNVVFEIRNLSKRISFSCGISFIIEYLYLMAKYYTIEDVEIFYNAKTLFYEIGYDGQPVKNSDIVGDNHGNLLHIGIRDGEYNICYYVMVGENKDEVEECIAGQKLLLKILNNGNIEPIESGIDIENVFNQLEESTKKIISPTSVKMYQPKLYLRFEPPIQNDKVGHNQLYKVLGMIENEYSSVYWFEGQSPAEFNPFTDTEDEDVADQVKSLTIGHWPDSPNFLTYGQWDDNDMNYQNAIDGWQWMKDHEVDYNQTSDIFNQLNENENYNPQLTYVFEPPIEDEETLRNVLYILNTEHPGLKWVNDKSILTYDIYSEVFDRNDAAVVSALSIGFFPENRDELTWTSWVDPGENYGPKVDGWSLITKYGIPNIEDIFNQLNESYDFLGQTNLKGFKIKQ